MQFVSITFSPVSRLLVCLCWFVLSMLPQLTWAVEPAPVTLQDALDLALSANPEIAVATREREAQQGARLQASARPNPVISAAMQDVRADLRQTTLQISQEFELGNKRDARIIAADTFYNKANIELEAKKVDIHANVVAAFYNVLVAQARIDLAKLSIKTASLALDAATKRVTAGKSAPVEQTKSKIAFAATQIEHQQANSQLVISRQQLTRLMGKNTSGNMPSLANSTTSGTHSPQYAMVASQMVVGQLEHIPDSPPLTTLLTLLENAPSIQLARMDVASRVALTDIERTKSTPNITISAGLVNNQELGVNQAMLGISIPIPLFDRNTGSVQEAVSREYKAQDTLSALKNQLATNVSDQHYRLIAAKQSVLILREDILPSAQSAFDAASKGFEFGKFSFLDVLDAQRTLFQVQSQYLIALADVHQAVAEIERILGDVIQHPLDKTLE